MGKEGLGEMNANGSMVANLSQLMIGEIYFF